MNNNRYLTKSAASASYRMPREKGSNEPSRVLRMRWDGSVCLMTGGKWGYHEIQATDNATVRAHWTGYVSNNMGRTVKPAIRWERIR